MSIAVSPSQNGNAKLSNTEKRRIVRAHLVDGSTNGLSNRRIAELCGVSHSFVAEMRDFLEGETAVEESELHVALMDAGDDPNIEPPPSAQDSPWRKVHDRTVRVTRDLAVKYRDMPRFGRNLDPRRLELLRSEYVRGELLDVFWRTCLCKEDGVTYRLNGQHTSTLLSEFDEPGIDANIVHYECETMEQMGRLYSKFDSKINSRTQGELNKAAASSVGLATISNSVVAGIAYAIHGERVPFGFTGTDRAALGPAHREFVVWATAILRPGKSGSSAKYLNRSPVIAAMMKTWERSPDDASEFWASVRDQSSPSNDSPDRILANYLMTTRIIANPGGKERGTKTRADRMEFYVKCSHAWNAWKRGAKTDLRYTPGKKFR